MHVLHDRQRTRVGLSFKLVSPGNSCMTLPCGHTAKACAAGGMKTPSSPGTSSTIIRTYSADFTIKYGALNPACPRQSSRVTHPEVRAS